MSYRITNWSDTPTPTEVFYDNFESYAGNLTTFLTVWDRSGGVNPLTTIRSKSPSYSLEDPFYFSPVGGFSPATDTVLFGFWLWFDGVSTSPFSGLVNILSGLTNNGFNSHCDVFGNAAGQLEMRRSSALNLVQTSVPCLVTNGWNYITGKLQITNPGVYQVYCNGALVLSGSANLAGSLDGPGIAQIIFGVIDGIGVDDVWYGYATSAAVYTPEPPAIRGFAVFGEKGTTRKSRSVVMSLDGSPHVNDREGICMIYGDLEVTGDTTLSTAGLENLFSQLVITEDGELVVDEDGNPLLSED